MQNDVYSLLSRITTTETPFQTTTKRKKYPTGNPMVTSAVTSRDPKKSSHDPNTSNIAKTAGDYIQ